MTTALLLGLAALALLAAVLVEAMRLLAAWRGLVPEQSAEADLRDDAASTADPAGPPPRPGAPDA